ncbi:protein Cep78 homolog [Drosophila obscura]|uniref:protein Cep78 homolog n=1 Tax=Drosophila obscura TaxID=7282 RepID=UPI001BB0F64A|nr:protein Cep78 homolog [Drosophila obscura]
MCVGLELIANMSLSRVSGIRNGQLRDLAKKASSAETLPTLVRTSSTSRCFHFRYMELCRAKNLAPLPEIRNKSKENTLLELFADKLTVNDWMMVIEALQHDIVLQSMVLHMRRSYPNNTIEPIDTENRARLFRQRPVVFTRFIFRGLVEAIANCVSTNKNLTVLKLEGLPLCNGYIEAIAKSLAATDSLETLSFRRSSIGDKGCEMVCNTAKYLNRIAFFDLSECNISSEGAFHVANMIKMQKILQYTEGWEKSLRYQTLDVGSILGLRTIILANNPNIGDQGLRCIAEVLKEDAWIKIVDMQGCGLTDIGANLILDCLDLNSDIQEFNVQNNEGISHFLQRSIREQLGIPQFEKKPEPEYDLSCFKGLQSLPKGQRFTISQLLQHIKILEQQLSFERVLRKKAERLNVKLSNQLMSSDAHLTSDKFTETSPTHMPNEHLELTETHIESPTYRSSHASKLVNTSVPTPETTPRSDLPTLRNDPQDSQYSSRLESEQTTEVESMEVTPCEEDQVAIRTLLQVRKVRSEMKYVERNVKDSNKNHESRSDHEFANERHYKLNAMVRFEQDIGDSVQVGVNKQGRDRYEGGGDGSVTNRYDSAVKAKRDAEERSRLQKRQVGDGTGIWNHNFSVVLANNREANGKCIPKRCKGTPEYEQTDEYKHRKELRDKVETYIGLHGPAVSSETTADGSTSEPEVPNSKMLTSEEYPSMVVFRRRRHPDIVKNDGMSKLSPRTAYLRLKKMNREASS